MTQLELDPQFVQGLRLLHSSNKESMDQLRILLDETIRQKHGLSKMLCNVLHKKYTMEEPVLSDHSSTSSKKSKSSSSSSKHSGKSSKSNSPEELNIRVETPPDLMESDDPLAQILEDDLTCVVCKGMDVGARNRLVECGDCHALYHQECHTPPIQDTQIDVPRLVWYCSNCLKAHQPVKEKGSPKPAVDSKKESKKSSSGSKHSDKYKGSSSHSNLNASDSSTASSAPKITPTIHIISGDKRTKESTRKTKDKRSASSSSKYSSSSSSSSKNSTEKSSYKSKTNSSD